MSAFLEAFTSLLLSFLSENLLGWLLALFGATPIA